jgi:hypothetical protein
MAKDEVVTVADFQELGSATTNYSRLVIQDYNPQLRGTLGIRKYDEMRRSDAQVRASLKLVKTPVLGGRWFVDSASPSKQDKKVAAYVQDCLFNRMTASWPQLLKEIMLHLDFGWYAFEKVYSIGDDGKVFWQKWAPRHPMTALQWMYDSKGGPLQVVFGSDTGVGSTVIPIDQLLVFTNDRESNNMEGISVLRSAYKHWYYKDNLYKIDAIQKERHGIGVPIIRLPPGFQTSDKALADQLGANLRTNEKAHVVLPPLWDIATLKIEGQPVDALQSAIHHGNMLYENVLGSFIAASRPSAGVGEAQDLFAKATRSVADEVRDVINKWAIPELVDYNWKTVTEYPTLKVRRVGDTVDYQKLSFAVRNLIGAGAIIPDEVLEDWLRDEMDLPQRDPSTSRLVATPQIPQPPTGSAPDTASETTPPGTDPAPATPIAPKPARVGPPRQSTAARSRQGKTAGSKNVGNDKSGGK